ncbi:CAP domain-containing protein [Micromonospora haikouensis]|uniref:CAP domain-containing protein n=1 Tax=Micromonospora haikouensis TaxID=686309 RepID=UPI003D737392
MEATGVYGWTDPNDPEGARWRQEPPADEPAWLTDRPAPRSTYLFGDEPDQPSDQRHTAQPPMPPADRPWPGEPTAPWHSPEPPNGQPHAPEQPSGQWHSTEQPSGQWHSPEPRSDRWHASEPHAPERASGQWYPADQPAPAAAHTRALPVVEGPAVAGPTVGSATPAAAQPADLAARRAGTAAGSGEGRHRPARRLPRPLLIGGAAAAATLVVSLGVGALVLPGGDAPRTDPAAADAPIAAPADPAEPTSAGPSPTPSPSASPTSASPSPSPSRTAKPTPKPSRTTAASRSNQRSSAPATPRVAAAPGVSAQAQEVVNLVNAERAKAGCGALKIDDKLMAAAQAHSQDQADHRKMTHDGSDGSDVGERLDRAGYAWRAYGENVAWNQQTPAAVMDAWMNSPGHRANILNCSFTEIGVGVANSNGPYWTQDFGTPR